MTILLSSTEAGAGKTVVALALAEAAKEWGTAVGYCKPVAVRSGDVPDGTTDPDVALARDLLDGGEATVPEPVVYSPSLATAVVRGREDDAAIRSRIERDVASVATGHDLVVVEGGGSVSAGGVLGVTDAALAELVDASVVLVAPFEETRDADAVLAAAELLGDRLAGVLFDAVPDAAFDTLASDVVPRLDAQGLRVFGTVPRDPELLEVPVSGLPEALDADVLTGGVPLAGSVRRSLVAASDASEARDRLRDVEDAVCVAGGGRTSVQALALEADGVRCLVVAGEVHPSETVLERAETAEVPVLRVPTDPDSTIARVDDVLRAGRPCDRGVVERMVELLGEYADVDATLGR